MRQPPYTQMPLTRTFNILRQRIVSSPRRVKRFFFVALDFFALVGMLWLGFSIRFGKPFMPNWSQAALILALPVIAIPLFIRLGIYRSVLRYLPDRAIWAILRATTIAILIWICVAFLTQVTGAQGVPRSIPIMLWFMACAYMVFSRFGAKWLLHGQTPLARNPRQTLIYGTEAPGIQLVQALRASSDRAIAGLVSEDPSLVGRDVMGLRVYRPADIERLAANMGIHEVIMTSTSPMTQERRNLVTHLRSLPVKTRVLPPLADIAAGRYLISSVRDIDIDDLLGRSEVSPDQGLLHAAITGKNILVTGAAGSIGSAVCRIVSQFAPAKLVMLDFNEHGLYQIDRELRENRNIALAPILGSITDRRLLDRLLAETKVDTIFHCAAYKHVTLVEENVREGVINNIFGTSSLAEAAARAGVGRFVLISSDKAVHPASVMGATKRWAEMIMHHSSKVAEKSANPTIFSSVRFGNVIGSSGSVVPLFKEQIARGGPVTITHNDMTRYFMSIREAAELIVQASALAEGGGIFVLEMGESIGIRQLAEDMIAIAGKSLRTDANPDGDIEIVIIGPRRGEKIQEELFYNRSAVTPTTHPKILRAKRNPARVPELPEKLRELEAALETGDKTKVHRVLFGLIQDR